ncbi:MAG: ATP-binding protein [Candidatus Methanomethylophilaceae archaeon]|nr:ATP-binding protein [Candidatus Methanomethylophilaceae archaeon]
MENPVEDKSVENRGNAIPTKTLILYVVFLILAVAITLNDIYVGRIDQLVLSVPTSIMLLMAIISDRKVAHIPPMIILLMMITLTIVVISNEFKDEHFVISTLSSILTGVCLMLMGQVVVYTMLHSSPEKEQDNKAFVYTAAFSIAMTVLLLMFVMQSVYYHFNEYAGFEIWVITQYVIFAIIGALLSAILSDLGLDRFFINSSLNRNLEVYSNSAYSNELAKKEAIEIIASGESEKLEFKSTITTNIRTGENDKRMEKAVLKSIVAFLNTSGGILMIGVSDDGSIYGVDENAFDNRDKMNLHLTHMISSKIGDEFFPYISFRLIDMEDGKAIIRVDCSKCKKPVFLKDGKTEEFYVRSGPSSVELIGSNLVNYVNNKSSKDRQTIIRGIKIIQEED